MISLASRGNAQVLRQTETLCVNNAEVRILALPRISRVTASSATLYTFAAVAVCVFVFETHHMASSPLNAATMRNSILRVVGTYQYMKIALE